jgi:4'-phosphopantetheinyl transferase
MVKTQLNQINFNHILAELDSSDIIVAIKYSDFKQESHYFFDRVLSDDEQLRASKYVVDKPRHNFIITRGLLRLLLSNNLNCNPETILFKKNNHGKPFIKNSSVFFNVSHSGDYCVIALSRRSEIGIDIEVNNTTINKLAIIKRFFSIQEQDWIFSQEKERLSELFYRTWTAKEAVCKAIGVGLWSANNMFSVIASSNKFYVDVNTKLTEFNCKKYAVSKLDLAEEYWCSVSVQESYSNIKLIFL